MHPAGSWIRPRASGSRSDRGNLLGVTGSDLDTFEPFPKIARLLREIVITEKIDGTNAQVVVSDDGATVRAASRTTWITPEKDNKGFARWVQENAEQLKALGPGRHFGEWWGAGIGRKYGLSEKRFSLFNVARWGESRPACCGVVPVLYRGMMDTAVIREVLNDLAKYGSKAAPGFMNPEGIIVFHTHGGHLYKVTLDQHDQHKGLAG